MNKFFITAVAMVLSASLGACASMQGAAPAMSSSASASEDANSAGLVTQVQTVLKAQGFTRAT